jgi:myo-inositol-1(or 4)-monophosphatase
MDERTTAIHACERAAELSVAAFRDGRPAGDYGDADVTTDIDRACEDHMVAEIREQFLADAVRAEERGTVGLDADREWVIDPLDGTNNVGAGLPLFAHAVCLRDREGPLLSVVHEPLAGNTYVAERDAGATVNGEPITAGTDLRLESGTVSLVPGEAAIRQHEELLDRVASTLEPACKRVLSTWAPCVDWGLLARGQLEAVVTVHPDVWEQPAGSLLAREANASIQTDENGSATSKGVGVYAADAATRDALVDLL